MKDYDASQIKIHPSNCIGYSWKTLNGATQTPICSANKKPPELIFEGIDVFQNVDFIE